WSGCYAGGVRPRALGSRRARSPTVGVAMTSPGADRLRALRDRLLRLHAALLDRERRAWEAEHGPITSGRFLQLLIHDDAFAWLRPLSGIIASSEAGFDEDGLPADVEPFFREAQRLLRSGEAVAFATKYHAALQESPDIVMAHADVVKTLPRRGS